MVTIAQYFEQAQLSLAAYALGLTQGMPNADYEAALEAAGIPATQAATFASTYTVVDQYTDSLTGFSVTVFDKGGVKYFAVRGTEKPTASAAGFAAFLADVGTDINGIGGNGVAIDQGISMFNYYLRATAAQGATVKQYDYLPALNGQPASITERSIIVSTDGALIHRNPDGSVTTDSFSVSGHSLNQQQGSE